jgi:hypothetical protein
MGKGRLNEKKNQAHPLGQRRIAFGTRLDAVMGKFESEMKTVIARLEAEDAAE